MTAKEEAEELLSKYWNSMFNLNIHIAKECALIAVEFAENQFDKYCCAEMGLHWTKDDERTDGSYDHFRYLKQEIEKL